MANKLFYGSIDYDTLLEAIKSKKAKTKVVTRKDKSTFRSIDIQVWINEEPDQYNNDGSIKVSMKEEFQNDKFYLGNIKESKPKPIKEVDPQTVTEEEDDDLPF